jgi:hypothetical protein
MVPEDDNIKNSTGREEEELFESEKQNVRVLQSTFALRTQSPFARQRTPSSQPSSHPDLQKKKSEKSVYNVTKIPISSRTSSSTNVKEPALPKSQSEVSL